DEGAVRRLLDPRRREPGGGRRVGEEGAARAGRQARDPAHPRRRGLPAGQRVDQEGAPLPRDGRVDRLTESWSARRVVEAVWRMESARIVATVTRRVGDFAFAEDLAQEALVEALRKWPEEGVPPNPGAWLTTVAARKAIDAWRRRERLDERHAAIAADLASRVDPDALPWDPDAIDDDVLRLVFIACHPVLDRKSVV